MRSVRIAAIVGAVAACAMVGMGSAAAEPEQPEPRENIFIDVNVLGCSFGAGLGGDVLVALGAGSGSSAMVNSSLAGRLRAAGCLPSW
ncbi:hypothetical protein BOX37_08530 [Nocardia mangyaensis]|uniref:Uncharacterized protein n=1 Tax=Nocardia mangyaensis TaxID=2213200 RepID=A0A1J0VPS3_9NOCA|nr:hypothetical protein [Nocardia mangyaensis]APE34009.1 hypothetical protein BOX37_08530 [Nocardia mangyaensis]